MGQQTVHNYTDNHASPILYALAETTNPVPATMNSNPDSLGTEGSVLISEVSYDFRG